MNIIIAAIGFPLSLFFLLMAYWKEDKILEQIGSIMLLVMAISLATGIQIHNVIPVYNTTFAGANYTEAYSMAVSVGEGFFLTVLISVLDLIQYFYFSHQFEFVQKERRRE